MKEKEDKDEFSSVTLYCAIPAHIKDSEMRTYLAKRLGKGDSISNYTVTFEKQEGKTVAVLRLLIKSRNNK